MTPPRQPGGAPGTDPRAPRAVRRFGQNFLANDALAEALVGLFAPAPGDVIVEIGPGPGALTRHLAPRCRRFVAFEVDPRMIPGLEALLAPWPHAEVRLADALETDWDALAAELGAGPPGGPDPGPPGGPDPGPPGGADPGPPGGADARPRVIGNLPYNVGTPIVRRILGSDAVRDLQVVLQLEVAERLLAGPGGKDYGPLSVIAALRARREKLRLLAPGCFRPPPKVTSCALRLVPLPHPPLPAAEIPALERWLFAGFGQRRKTLAGNLGALGAAKGDVQHFLVERGLPADARAEAVPPRDWLDLSRRFSGSGS